MSNSDNSTARETRESFLTHAEAAAINKPLQQASVPPLRIYTSKPYFEREVDAVLRTGWHALARVQQFTEAGSYVVSQIASEQVLMLQDKDGTIRALSNVCRHRGTQLLSDCGVTKAIICPYHTWTYNLDGTLRGAPHMNNSEGFDRKSIRLPEFKVEVWNGFVFVNLDANAAPLGPQITGLTEALAPFKLDGWVALPYRQVVADWNWKISLENFTEAYHHVGVHRNTIGKISPADKVQYQATNTHYSLFHVFIDAPESEFVPHDPDFPFPHVQGLPEYFNKYSPVCNIYPMFHMLLGPNFGLWLRIDVLAVDKHTLNWSWLIPGDGATLPDLAQRLAGLDEMFAPIIAEDLDIMPRVKIALESRAFVPGRYCDQELAVHEMHRWLLARMQEHGALHEHDQKSDDVDRRERAAS